MEECATMEMDDDFLPSTSPSTQNSQPIEKNCNMFQCQYCGLSFSVKSNCTRHARQCCGNKKTESAKFSCSECNAVYNRIDNLKAHRKKCASVNKVKAPKIDECAQKNSTCPSTTKARITETGIPENDKSDGPLKAKETSSSSLGNCGKKTMTPCLIEDCDLEFYHKQALIEHLESKHKDVYILKPVVKKEFSSVEEFNNWKEAEEESTYSYFCVKKGQANSRIKHFYCQHDGTAKFHSKRKTDRRKKIGRIKVGHFCIAKMKVWKDEDQKVHLEYMPTHSHICTPNDFNHHPLSNSTDRFINEQISWGVSPSKIFKNISDISVPRNASGKVQNVKNNILTKKRIRERARKRRNAQRLHKDDAVAVFLLAKQLMESDGSVLIYKPYGSGVVYGPAEIDNLPDAKELFMFGLQTNRQLELMKQHCGKIVIVDETHGTNQYKYNLLTVMVFDENRRGWPVAHLISSKSDAATLQFFFSALKTRLGDVNINCVITDDAPALINSMNAGFLEKLLHILCKWHVIKNFKENLHSKVSDKELIDTMLYELRVIINAKEEDLFLKLSAGFIKKYKSNTKTSAFISYFEKNYMCRTELWAMCYRSFPHAEVNTTGHIESFHSRLKKVYLKRKVNKRLDDLINILCEIEWEDYCTRYKEGTLGLATLPQPIFERHQRGLHIKDEDVLEVLENTWEVKSASTQDLNYVVVRYTLNCSFDLCFSKCQTLSCSGLCAHMYGCSCPDQHPLCKHIHKLHAFMNRDQPRKSAEEVPEFYVLPGREQPADEEPQYHEDDQETDAYGRKFLATVSRLDANLSFLNNFAISARQKKAPQHVLEHVDASITDLVRRLDLMMKVDNNNEETNAIQHMEPSVTFNSNETLKSQISQLASFKRPQGKRKRQANSADLASKKAKVVRDLLDSLSDDVEVLDGACEDLDGASEDLVEACENLDVAVNQEISSDYATCRFSEVPQGNSVMGSTLSSLYVSDPFDHVLYCGEDNISLIHLKSLELNLPEDEEKKYRKRDPIFKVGWLYSSIINAFLFRITQENREVYFMPSDFAIRPSNNLSNARYLTKRSHELQSKKIILFPANITNNHWTIFAIMIKEGEIRYYDPLQNPISEKGNLLLSQTAKDMRVLFPHVKTWKVVVVKLPKQTDYVNCGPSICLFADLTRKGEAYKPLECPQSFRQYMYNFIVGNCLKRSNFNDESCGKCLETYDNGQNSDETWVCCFKCKQWYHDVCIDFLGGSSENCVCP